MPVSPFLDQLHDAADVPQLIRKRERPDMRMLILIRAIIHPHHQPLQWRMPASVGAGCQLTGKRLPWVQASTGMSALGQKRSFTPGQANVRFAPKAVIRPRSSQCLLCADSGRWQLMRLLVMAEISWRRRKLRNIDNVPDYTGLITNVTYRNEERPDFLSQKLAYQT